MTDNDDSYPLTDDDENLEEIVARFTREKHQRQGDHLHRKIRHQLSLWSDSRSVLIEVFGT